MDAFLADALVLIHLGFIVFVVLGAALLFRWPRLVWLHVPAMFWGAYVEFTQTICPLTPLENALRARAGQGAYHGGFVEHYVLALMYPDGLNAQVQMLLGLGVVAINAVLYGGWWSTRRGRGKQRSSST